MTEVAIIVPSVFVTTFTLVVGVWVLVRKGGSKSLSVLFFILTLNIATWAMTIMMSWLPIGATMINFWSNATFWGPIFLLATLVAFTLVFPDDRYKLSLSKLLLIYAPVGPLMYLALSEKINIETLDPYTIERGPGIVFFNIYFIVYVVIALFILANKYKITQGVQKMQLRFVFLGLFSAVMTGAFLNLFLPLVMGNAKLTFLGPSVAGSIFIIFIAYAVLKHGLFEIKVIATELLVFLLVFLTTLRAVFSDSTEELMFDVGVIFFVIIIGINLIRSVLNEVQHREKLEVLTAELQKANNELKALDQMKDELVSIASHELRTPATAIKSYLWMALNKQKDNLNDDLARYISRAYDSSDRLIDLVNDMLSTSRLEGGRIELDLGEHDIVLLTKEYVEELQIKAQERGLTLTLSKPISPLPLVVVDEEKYAEIIINLIGNALKYTDRGSINLHFELSDKRSPNDPVSTQLYAWVHITDSGRGINQEDIPRLFKKFEKLEQGSFVRSAEAGGTGLGLYITKGLVELHGGEVWVVSNLGKGSTFSFSLRVAG